ncbi:MAG: ATP-binding cassette domain-containing protein [Candidatus Cloacimonetes bacterium]|nr:ATP-binding cassette domain-containing protein [Candidatus Cloacimonadota bacterium]
MIKIEDFSLLSEEITLFNVENLTLEDGQHLILSGNNNSGKSLFLKVLHGNYSNFTGSIEINEKPLKFYRKRKISILIDHNTHLFLEKSVMKNILLPISRKKSDLNDKIMELFTIAELGEIYKIKIGLLSLSTQKIIELIRAVVQNPHLIMFDGLDRYFDSENTKIVEKILKTTVENGTIFIGTAKSKIDTFQQNFSIIDKKVISI